MTKKLISFLGILILIPFCFRLYAVPIVNNSGHSGEDTLTFNILNFLPSGNPANKLDSAYFTVFKSHTNDVVFRDSSTGVTMPGVDSFVIGGDVVYYFHRSVSDIDGSGADGVYSYNFMAIYDDSSMRTPTNGQFQITGWELDDFGDSAGLAALRSTIALDSLHLIIDSLMAALDTLQNQDDWVSSFVAATDQVTPTDTTSSGNSLFACSGGEGGYSVQLVVFDSSTSQVVPGAGMAVRNVNQTALIAVGSTDMQGEASFNLAADSFVVIVSSPGFIFDNFDTLVVSGSGIDTVFGYQFNPGTPADPTLCRVYGYIFDIEGNPESDAKIAGSLPAGARRLGTTIVSPFKVETQTDVDGYFYLDLIPSANLTPPESKYEITITLDDGTVLRERITVPDLSSWQLTW